MKIYALRDRLLDYFKTPFCAENDNDVKAGISSVVSFGQSQDDVSQAPHHFELWQLGEVLQGGEIVPKLDFIADVSSLVRRGIRQNGRATPGNSGPDGPESERRSSAGGAPEGAATSPAPIPESAIKPAGSA